MTDPDSTSAAPAAQPALATHRERYGLLLGAIIVAFAIQGIAEPGKFEEVLVAVLLGATLLLALWVADAKPRVMWVAVVIVTALILISVVEAAGGGVGGGATRIANALLVGLAPPAIILGVIRSLRARQAVTLEAVFGVLCVYILLGMFFASVYGTIDRFGGNPFFAAGQPATVARLPVLQLLEPHDRRLWRFHRAHEPRPHAVGVRGAARADLPRHDRLADRGEPRSQPAGSQSGVGGIGMRAAVVGRRYSDRPLARLRRRWMQSIYRSACRARGMKGTPMADVAQDTQDTLLGISIGDANILETAIGLRDLGREGSGLDARTYALVKIAALIALDAPPTSYAWQIANALDEGVTPEDVLGVLRAVAFQVGAPKVVAAAPEIMLALGLTLPEEG